MCPEKVLSAPECVLLALRTGIVAPEIPVLTIADVPKVEPDRLDRLAADVDQGDIWAVIGLQ